MSVKSYCWKFLVVTSLQLWQQPIEAYIGGTFTRKHRRSTDVGHLGMKNVRRVAVIPMLHSGQHECTSKDDDPMDEGRREMIKSGSSFLTGMMIFGGNSLTSSVSRAAESDDSMEITSKIFLELKGLSSTGTDRVVIGLFGKAAPHSVSIIQALCSPAGWDSPCRPLEQRMLQKDQLEANKVFNACVESQDKGVTYDFSAVWRIIPDQQIEIGAVTGKYLSRIPPHFDDKQSVPSSTINTAGLVTVRRGNDGGFGFSILPVEGLSEIDWENRIIVGRVLDGMSVVNQLNTGVPIVQRSSSSTLRTAPSRACRYGSTEFYCNDYKPLKKILITQSGVLSS